MKNYKIKIEDVFAHTNGGLDIIRHYLEHIDEYVGKNKHFALRDEKTPSCTIRKMNDGNYVITDFGSSQRMNGIMFIQYMENVDFGEAVRIAASRHQIPNAEHVSQLFDPAFSRSEASPDHPDGHREFYPADETPKEWLEIIFSRKTIENIRYKHKHVPEEKRDEAVWDALRKVLLEQHWHPLDGYLTVNKRMANKITASTYYPIFRIEEEGKTGEKFQKIYQPKAKNKKHRFFYHGKFDRTFLHGLKQVEKKHAQLIKDFEPNEEDENEKEPKLDQVIYCTGGSDALNFYALGYDVVYPSSESFKLYEGTLKKLFTLSDKVLTCPDLDDTGRRVNFELCMNPQAEIYLNIETIELPQKLKRNRDQYGRPCKDVRDFLNYYSARELRGLVRTARKFKFWDYHLSTDKNGNAKMKFGKPIFEWRISAERVLFFLEQNGFVRHRISEDETEYVHIHDNVVKPIKPEDIKAFMVNFLRDRFQDEELINLVHRSTILNESTFSTLPIRELDFRDYDYQSQFMFFENATWHITKEGIQQHKPAQSPRMVWHSKILPHNVRLLDEMFTVARDNNGEYNLEIQNQDCMFFRFLIQTSRVHWRAELEDNLAGLPIEEQEKYREENKFNIAGPNLTKEQQRDQIKHLLNKMFAFGYLMHRHKSPSKPWSVVLMDDTPNRDNASHGGTGKSIFFEAVSRIKNRLFLDGKDVKLFEDNHVFEKVSETTDVIYIDDCDQRFPFKRIFSMTTGAITINPKGRARSTIEFDDSPKFAFTTNFAPDDLSPSTMRRILFGGMSNYFHSNTDGSFNERRQPVDDFGKELFNQFTPDEWNTTLNFMAQCCRFYLNQTEMIEAPMANIMERSLTNEIGLNFLAWAEVFFTGTRLDSCVMVALAADDYVRASGIRSITIQGFNSKMRSYARLKNLNLNPKELTQKDGRIIKHFDIIEFDNRTKQYFKPGGKKTQSFIYLQSNENVVSENIYDPVLEQERDETISTFGEPIDSEAPKF